MNGLDRILDSAVVQLNSNHVTPGGFHGFLNGDRHFTGLATSEAHFAFTVTNHSQGGKAEYAATLDHFSHAVYLDQLLLEIAVLLLLFLIVKSHIDTLEIQSTFTGGIGEGLDASVVLIAAAIESYSFDTGRFGAFCHQLTYSRCGLDIAG